MLSGGDRRRTELERGGVGRLGQAGNAPEERAERADAQAVEAAYLAKLNAQLRDIQTGCSERPGGD